MKDVDDSSFICPNDRQLNLRAKLDRGWSTFKDRTPKIRLNNPNLPNDNNSLNEDELERIKRVLERAQRIDYIEQERVNKLIDRLDNIKKHVTGNGSSQCVLCAIKFGMLGASPLICVDCQKSVCNKCSMETIHNQQMILLCKICSETRDLWKKSGAWFSRKTPMRSSLIANIKPSSSILSSVTTKSDSESIDDNSSSDEQIITKETFIQETPPKMLMSNTDFPNVNPFQQLQETINTVNNDNESISSFKIDQQSSQEPSFDENTQKFEPIQSPIPSRSTTSTSLSTSVHQSSSAAVNTSSPLDDCGFGTLDFEIIWKVSLNTLTIKLHHARNLRSCDSNGLSDPYVKMHLVPGVAKATKLRSHTIRKTLNPDFDEIFFYNGISADDMKLKSLKFSVYDEDSVGSDFLGEYRLKLSTLHPDVNETYSVYLQNKTDDNEMPTDEDKSERGRILLSLMYSKSTCSFHVKVIRGSQLLPMDFGRTSDPYCKLRLFPTNDMGTKWNFKTSVKRNTLHPEYNEEFIFQHVQLQELISKTLQVTVYDKDVGKKDDYIGGFQLGSSASGDDIRHWLLMVKSVDQWVEMWHKLTPQEYNSTTRHRDSVTSQ